MTSSYVDWSAAPGSQNTRSAPALAGIRRADVGQRTSGAAVRRDADLDRHAEIVAGEAHPRSVQWDRLSWIAGNRDPDEVAISDNAVCRIELDPASARQIDLDPSMGCSSADMVRSIPVRGMEVARHEPRRQPE